MSLIYIQYTYYIFSFALYAELILVFSVIKKLEISLRELELNQFNFFYIN